MKSSKKTAAFCIAAVMMIFIAVVCVFTLRNSKKDTDDAALKLKAYRNTVALYSENDIVRTYDVVLDTLPESDIRDFEKGIDVLSVGEAEEFMENYDG